MDKRKVVSTGTALEYRVSEEAIARLVDRFYAKVRSDPQLEYVIDNAIVGDWAGHLARMRDFWAAAMSSGAHSPGDPVDAHLRFDGMDRTLLARWIALFDETCSELFDEHLAAAFRVKAARIAEKLRSAISYEGVQSRPGSGP